MARDTAIKTQMRCANLRDFDMPDGITRPLLPLLLPAIATGMLIASALSLSGVAHAQSSAEQPKKLSPEEVRREIERRSAGGMSKDDKSVKAAERSPEVEKMSRGELVRAARVKLDPRTIYGPDDRMDYGEVADARIKSLMDATVALFNRSDFRTSESGTAKFNTKSLSESMALCPSEKYSNQAAGAFCSGALIAPDRVLTAGHCAREISNNFKVPHVDEIAFVFGFRANDKDHVGAIEIPAEQVFMGSKVLGGELESGRGRDWAVVQLERPVPESLARPLTNISTAVVEMNTDVFVIGHPSGLPVKYAPNGLVRSGDDPAYFVANLDTFGGNSGSPVFEAQTNALVGMLVRGGTDYVYDAAEQCRVANVCPNTGCRGEDVMRISAIQLP
jgi:V8-like Glu-specific endopeptidase